MRLQQHVFGAHVQVVGRLVQQQKIRRRNQNPRQCKAVALAAGQHAQRLEDVVAAKRKQPSSDRNCLSGTLTAARLMSSSMRASPSSTLYWSCAKYSLTTLWPSLTVPGRRRFLAGQQFDERGFAGAVHAHQRHAVAALDGEADIVEHLLCAITLREPLGLRNHAPRGRRLRKLEVDDRLLLGNLDALDLFQFLDAALHLLGLGGLRAEAIDECLKVLDLLALVAVRRLNCVRRSSFWLRYFV